MNSFVRSPMWVMRFSPCRMRARFSGWKMPALPGRPTLAPVATTVGQAPGPGMTSAGTAS